MRFRQGGGGLQEIKKSLIQNVNRSCSTINASFIKSELKISYYHATRCYDFLYAFVALVTLPLLLLCIHPHPSSIFLKNNKKFFCGGGGVL